MRIVLLSRIQIIIIAAGMGNLILQFTVTNATQIIHILVVRLFLQITLCLFRLHILYLTVHTAIAGYGCLRPSITTVFTPQDQEQI